MPQLDRITFDPIVMGAIVGLIASGAAPGETLPDFQELEAEDIRAALSNAAWRSVEIDIPLARPEDHRST